MTRRMLVLTEGSMEIFGAKTATCLMRYVPDEVVGVLDSTNVGKSTKELLGVKKDFPIFASIQKAMTEKPNILVIGVAPQGGKLNSLWRRYILDAISEGMHIYSGLHQMLAEDEEFAAAANEKGVQIWDIRKPPEDLPVGKALAREHPALRILTIGTDCNVGKMVTTLEITNHLNQNGQNAFFVATGQTGVLVSGSGMALDRVISDFVAGATEKMVMEQQDKDILLIEGQGSLLHPGFSAVTLGLLHGSLPHGVILVHHPKREFMRGNKVKLAPFATHIELCEKLCEPIFPTKIIGIAINGFGLSEEELQLEIKRAQDETGLPATDVIKYGAGPLADAVLELRSSIHT